MGARGRVRQPDSVRGLREGGIAFNAPEPVTPPKWLSGAAKREFKTLVVDLTAANVPIKQVDSWSIAMAAHCVSSVAEWAKQEQEAQTIHDKLECSKQSARFQRDAQQWLAAICANPQSRARIGLRDKPKKQGELAKLLELKKKGNER